MPGSVNQVEFVPLPIKFVIHLNGMALDGDPPLLLQFHAVENLVVHIPLRHRIGDLQQPVGQGTLPMVNMCDDTKITDIVHFSAILILFRFSQPHLLFPGYRTGLSIFRHAPRARKA